MRLNFLNYQWIPLLSNSIAIGVISLFILSHNDVEATTQFEQMASSHAQTTLNPPGSSPQITAGSYHTCSITSVGGAVCWGENGFSGKLGNNSYDPSSAPIDVNGLSSGVLALSAGLGHTCAALDSNSDGEGSVRCWGWNGSDQLGINNPLVDYTPYPAVVVGLTGDVTSTAVGDSHSCALTAGGDVNCWGSNAYGQTGDGEILLEDGLLGLPGTLREVSGLSNDVLAIVAGSAHTCALVDAGNSVQSSVKCWGDNSSGQLGDGSNTMSSTPVDVVGLDDNVVSIAAGVDSTCAIVRIDENTRLKCWGANFAGQLGDGTMLDRNSPTDVSNLNGDVIAVALSRPEFWLDNDPPQAHTCALLRSNADGENEARCWGSNHYGQLGNGTTVSSTTPVSVTGLMPSTTAISNGAHHTCTSSSIDVMQCWGDNRTFQLGDGIPLKQSRPVEVPNLSNNIKLVEMGYSHTCSLTESGTVQCWGNNWAGQIGNGSMAPFVSTPSTLSGFEDEVTEIFSHDDHTCALLRNNSLECWGFNRYGQLGDGTTTDRSLPVPVEGLDNIVSAVAMGSNHTCALLDSNGDGDGGVQCWGDNDDGQLGDGTTISSTVPVGVTGLDRGVTAIVAGGEHTCALLRPGNVQCWGRVSDGSLGDGKTDESAIPIDVAGLTEEIIALAAGSDYTCALSIIGNVQCWGVNEDGQLGNDSFRDADVPEDVVGLTSEVVAISAGYDHTCALLNNEGAHRQVKCWGDNYSGELGNGHEGDESGIPVDVIGLPNDIVAISAGGTHTCAITEKGKLWCWGSDLYGQLATGRLVQSSVPINVGVANLSTETNVYLPTVVTQPAFQTGD